MANKVEKTTSYKRGSLTTKGSFLISSLESICKFTPPPATLPPDTFIPDDTVTLPPIFPQKPTPTPTYTETFTYSQTNTYTPTPTNTETNTLTYTYTHTPTQPPTINPTYTPTFITDPTYTPSITINNCQSYTDIGKCCYCCEGYEFINWYRVYECDRNGYQYLASYGNFNDSCCSSWWGGNKWPEPRYICENIAFEAVGKEYCRPCGQSYKFERNVSEIECGRKSPSLPSSGGCPDAAGLPIADQIIVEERVCFGQNYSRCLTCNTWDVYGNPCCAQFYCPEFPCKTYTQYQGRADHLGRNKNPDCVCGPQFWKNTWGYSVPHTCSGGIPI